VHAFLFSIYQQRQVQRNPLCTSHPVYKCSACTQVAYLAKRNTDMLPEQMTALPCASTFPGSPARDAVPMASATVTVSVPTTQQPHATTPAP
jgi:hypothetical protein